MLNGDGTIIKPTAIQGPLSRVWTVPGDEQAQQVDMRLVMGWHRLFEIGTFCLHVKWASSDILHGLPVISFRWDKTFSKIVSLKWLPGIHTAYVQRCIIPIHVHWHISGIV